MDLTELSQRRAQMGRSIQPWIAANGPRAVGEVSSGYWLVLTGSPGADGNMALVHDGDTSTLKTVRDLVEARGYPTLLMLAGHPRQRSIGPNWVFQGQLPFMSLELASASLRPDGRVRRAQADDFDTVVDLVTEANPFGPEVAEVGVAILRERVDTPAIWLLSENDVPVSTVSSAVVDDAVCIWSMATPSRYGRRGYGRAILSHALHDAYSRSEAVIGLLTASPAGRSLYEAVGWSVVEEWEMFISPGRTESR
ncbi:MAG TPA: GNAT family N-acetyltransferase [Acidimicrobiales bacterium]|nr:GNAT family N-acetyltransferase [Acidimicrobiales bacterium]